MTNKHELPAPIKTAFEKTPWLIPELAPKKECFMGRFKGQPYPAQSHWSEAHSKWVYVIIQCDMIAGKWVDYYFQNELADEEDLISWIPMEAFK
jgi:hypothetical protein